MAPDIKQFLEELQCTTRTVNIAEIESTAEVIVETLNAGGKIIVCGNGGSASQAEHFEAELIGRYKNEREPLACICLNTGGASMSCIVNDFGGDYIFARGVQALAQKNDLLVVLTTSGNSQNIINAVNAAKEKSVQTLGLLGKGGGKVKPLLDQSIVIDSQSTARIQEMHLFIIHAICEYLEEKEKN